MPMTQQDIQTYYREHWGENTASEDAASLAYSSPIEDAVIYPIYNKLIQDLAINTNRILDIGCGSGRWTRFFLDRFTPQSICGLDFAESSVAVLSDWSKTINTQAQLSFHHADITATSLPIEGRFDLINIANVLFHIPEQDKFEQALKNIAALLAEGGRAVTTEYLPNASMRTNWMLVRSRYEFEAACKRAGLEIADIRACSFFSNDPMGIDGPDDATRAKFNKVRDFTQQLLSSVADDNSRSVLITFLSQIDAACLDYCNHHIAQIDMPAQKLVVLRAA
jgi:SAM-dependent methyltransferase